jgi:hypothetical protein
MSPLEDDNNGDDLIDLNMPKCLIDTIADMTIELRVEEGEIIQCRDHPDDPDHRSLLRNGVFWAYPKATSDTY